MMVHDQNRRPQSNNLNTEEQCDNEAGCLYALITGRRSVSRRNRASWYLRQLNKVVKCDKLEDIYEDDKNEQPIDEEATDNNEPENDNGPGIKLNNRPDEKDIFLVSITSPNNLTHHSNDYNNEEQRFLVTPKTRVLYLSKSIATSIILDLSPSVVSVSAQNDCVFLDSMYDALKRVLHLLVKAQEIPSASSREHFVMAPKVFVSVIAYTPFIIAKNNQVLIQNRRISNSNIEQVLVEVWICLTKLTQEIHELVTNTCGINLEYESAKSNGTAFIFPQPLSGSVIRHPGSVLEDIYELGLFSASLMPRLSRLSIVTITDGLFASTNNLNVFRLKSIALSFVSLGAETVHPDACFGYTPYTDLMRFVARSTQGVYISHKNLIEMSQNFSRLREIPFMSNPLYCLFSWTLHSDVCDEQICYTPRACNMIESFELTNASEPSVGMRPEHIAKFFCVDQPIDTFYPIVDGCSDQPSLQNELMNGSNYHDWRSFKQLDRQLDADFEQVLSGLLREGYLIKEIQFKQRETSRIVARLILHWKHNLDLEQELSAPYWNNTDPFDLSDSNSLMLRPFNAPLYGDTYCELIVHGSYSFLHNLYCDKKVKRKSDYREIAYKQFRQLIDGVIQTHERLQYLSRFYRDSSLSKIPSFLLHGNSLLYEQPHTHKLTSTIENVTDEAKTSDFQEYWQKISCLDTRSWKNLMHIHTLRLVLEHDQPKHKNIHCQNASGRYTHIQCRRALSAISNFIKGYASFALLEDTTYIKFIYNKDDDLREIETSATKGFIVIRINKLLPIVVIYLMFTSGILDSHRVQIVRYLEEQLVNRKLRNGKPSVVVQTDNILKSKTIYPSSESCCVLIKSPLERMLKVYSRNFIGEYLTHNLTLGLPGSYPFMQQHYQHQQSQSQTPATAKNKHQDQSKSANPRAANGQTKDTFQDDFTSDNSINRYNLVFGKYLYGVRVVHTIANLPHDLVHSICSNVLAKISAILVNARIKQGFHIAFNNSGILNLVVELAMKDHSHELHNSSCLCQYIVFPPAVTSCPQPLNAVLSSNNNGSNATSNNMNGNSNGSASSKLGSLSGSLANSDHSYLKSTPQDHGLQGGGDHDGPRLRNNTGEIKLIREYWIEQQYGVSSESKEYHKSLQNMRYSEIVDHLFLTDSKILECLLTYDLLQLLCHKMSPHYDLDGPLTQPDPRMLPIFSPTTISSSNSTTNLLDPSSPTSNLPSTLIEGNTRDGSSKIPLLEFNYEFSLVKFLDYCQQASLNVLLFRDKSDYFENTAEDLEAKDDTSEHQAPSELSRQQSSLIGAGNTRQAFRKTSVETMNNQDKEQQQHGHQQQQQQHNRREHRCSYDNLNSTGSYVIPIYSQSLNHLFLDTLHKRLKQMHDKELRLSDSDRRKLAGYLRRRKVILEFGQDVQEEEEEEDDDGDEYSVSSSRHTSRSTSKGAEFDANDDDNQDDHEEINKVEERRLNSELIEWRCFLRKGNQENLMIVLVPSSMADITRWMDYVDPRGARQPVGASNETTAPLRYDVVCPIFVFRCSSTIINDHVLSFLRGEPSKTGPLDSSSLEQDLSLHFGQACNYMKQLKTFNDELNNEILPLAKFGALNQNISDEKTLEIVHFRAFLRKIKNTVLKSRFSSLNEAYLSELFVHKDDILYYLTNVDQDTQKKYHVSSQLKNLADFIRTYQEYTDSLPKVATKSCNQLLNSILLQKCGLFLNQPIARFDESNPLIKQLHDRKLLFLMRCNYKLELPILEENLSESTLLKQFIKPTVLSSTATNHHTMMMMMNSNYINQPSLTSNNGSMLSSSINESKYLSSLASAGQASSSLGRSGAGSASTRLFEMRCGSMGGTGSVSSISGTGVSGSPNATFASDRFKLASQQAPRFSTTSLNSLPSPTNDSLILEAFRGSLCSISEISPAYLDTKANLNDDIGLRHEAHMAEVLKRKGERKESHHYRRVLKSKTNYNQSHGAIDQALKRVDSLGRLEHFCLTPLLFSPAWRSKLAPVRDHTLGELSAGNNRVASGDRDATPPSDSGTTLNNYHYLPGNGKKNQDGEQTPTAERFQQEADERWHQTVCANYIKEYEQYIQTLGFNSVQIRYQSSGSNSATGGSRASPGVGPQRRSSKNLDQLNKTTFGQVRNQRSQQQDNNLADRIARQEATSNGSLVSGQQAMAATTTTTTHNTGYLIKFLNSGCLVFKVGLCKPYVFSVLYSIEGERFNNSNLKMNMTAFLDELDNIKLTMHLHSFTYDYHLRSIYSYIAGRQTTFSPGYHLISFVDDFRKYYQKAPNYARNHILSGEVCISDINVSGQQLYNYIVTHNSVYNLDILEMSSSMVASLMFPMMSGNNTKDDQVNIRDVVQEVNNSSRSHANDYVLIELKREKVRYRHGKDPDVFECGLLITHDVQSYQQDQPSPNSLTLKYFLLLTNQKDLYPKLIHTNDTIVSLGCHRPIRLGANTPSQQLALSAKKTGGDNKLIRSTNVSTKAVVEVHSEEPGEVQSELLSSGEVSGHPSIVSTTNSVESSTCSAGQREKVTRSEATESDDPLQSEITEEAADALVETEKQFAVSQTQAETSQQYPIRSNDSSTSLDSQRKARQRHLSTTASSVASEGVVAASQPISRDRAICDEEITYLGYFSSDEMDMLKFLQEKTKNLRTHIEKIVREAEVHYRRDYLWHKLMQRVEGGSNKSHGDHQLPLSLDELQTLLQIVEAIDLASLDQQLAMFTTQHIDWYLKLLKAFNELKQTNSSRSGSTSGSSSSNLNHNMNTGGTNSALVGSTGHAHSNVSSHRIFTVKLMGKSLVLYIDPNCMTAFILMSIESERESIELNMMMKDKFQCGRIVTLDGAKYLGESASDTSVMPPASTMELDQECQQLINDFINFCATFMWSSLLN